MRVRRSQTRTSRHGADEAAIAFDYPRRLRVVIVAASFLLASSPLIYRDRPGLLPWSLAVVAVAAWISSDWRPRVPSSIAAFVLWAATSLLWTFDLSSTLIDLPTLAIAVFLGVVVASFQVEVIGRGLLAGAACAALVSLAVAVVGPGIGRSAEFGGALTGIYAHRNFLASVAVVGVALACGHLAHARRTREKWFLSLLLLIFVAVCLSTLSGAAIAVSVVVVAGAVLLWVFRSIGSALRYALAPLAIVIFFGLFVPAAVQNLENLTRLLGRDATFTGRTGIWEIVLNLAAERPVAGYGWGGVWRGEVGDYVRAAFGWDTANSAHNAFLDALLQVGLVGVGLLIATLLVAAARSVRLAMREARYLWMPLVVLAVAVNSLSESQATRPLGLFLIALVSSLALAQAGRPKGRPSALRRAEERLPQRRGPDGTNVCRARPL